MRITRLKLALLLLALPLLSLRAYPQTSRDVPKDHWAYELVQDLASKGLVKGYPPDGNFFGGRTVTRYEMAALVDRVLQRIEDLIAKKADKGEKLPNPPAEGVLDAKQLEEVRRLVDEFKIQLGLMGTDLQKVKDDVGLLKQDVSQLKTDVGTLKGRVDKHDEDIAGVKQGVQGAIDAVVEQRSRIDAVDKSKVGAGFGSIKLGGLLQGWIQMEKDAPKKGVVDSLRIRRAEIKLTGDINPKVYWQIMIDPAKQLALNTTTAGGNITSVSPNQSTNILQDAFVGYKITKNNQVAFEIGQQKVPMSMEGLRSSAQLLTVERAIFNGLPGNNGRVGDVRENGAMLRLTNPKIEAQLGVFDDGGNRLNTLDDNNDKELMYRLHYKGLRYLTFGGYQEVSGGVNGATKSLRQRAGAEATLNYGKHKLEAEYVRGRDGATPVNSHGGYLLYAYKHNPIWEFVARGEYWNPNKRLHGVDRTEEFDLTLGLNYYLTGHNAKIQFNWVRKNIDGPMGVSGPVNASFLGLDRSLFLTNFQAAF